MKIRKQTCSFFLACLLVPLLSCGASLAYAAKTIGAVTSIEGDAYATGIEAQRTLSLNDAVYEGETLHTRSDAKLVVTFADDTVLRMGEDSSVGLEQYMYDKEPKGLVGMVTNFFRGLVRLTTGKIVERNRDNFKFKTPLATLGIRGTEFYAETVEDGEEIGVLSIGEGHTVTLESQVDSAVIDKEGFYVKVSKNGKFSALMRISSDVSKRVMRMQSTFSRMRVKTIPRHPKRY